MGGLVGGWVGGSFRKYYHFVAPSCKLELARFPAELSIQDGAECGNLNVCQKICFSYLGKANTYQINIHICLEAKSKTTLAKIRLNNFIKIV